MVKNRGCSVYLNLHGKTFLSKNILKNEQVCHKQCLWRTKNRVICFLQEAFIFLPQSLNCKNPTLSKKKKLQVMQPSKPVSKIRFQLVQDLVRHNFWALINHCIGHTRMLRNNEPPLRVLNIGTIQNYKVQNWPRIQQQRNQSS